MKTIPLDYLYKKYNEAHVLTDEELKELYYKIKAYDTTRTRLMEQLDLSFAEASMLRYGCLDMEESVYNVMRERGLM